MTMLWSVLLALVLASGAWAQDLRIPQLVEGRGTAGGPVGGVLSVQGVVGGTPLPVTPAAGAVNDVNLIQVLGVAPSATNPVPSRISNGAAFIDPRDRTWTLASPGDSVTVSGTVTANQGGAWTMSATQGTSPWVVSGTVTSNQGGTWTVQPGNTANTTAWLVTGTGGTFPVTGTFWQATQPVSGTFWQATQPVSGTVTANAGTGTFATNVSQWGGTATTLGQKAMAASVPVVMASDQSVIPITSHASTTQSNYGAVIPDTGATWNIGATSKQVVAINDSNTATVYVKIGAGAATTGDFPLNPGQFIGGPAQVTQVAFITATGQTAPVRAIAWR
jgi:hypothetical protein